VFPLPPLHDDSFFARFVSSNNHTKQYHYYEHQEEEEGEGEESRIEREEKQICDRQNNNKAYIRSRATNPASDSNRKKERT